MKQRHFAYLIVFVLFGKHAFSQEEKLASYPVTSSLGSTFNVTRCNSYTLPWGGAVTTSGSYTHTYVVSGGRDSIVTANVTINYSKSTTLNVAVCNTQLPYNFGGTLLNTSGQYTRRLTSSAGCDSVITLNLVVSTTKPTVAVSSITPALVNNSCGARVFRYTASSVTNASGYAWMLPSSLGGVSGVMIDSGDVNFSRIIRVKYASSNAAVSTDQIKVQAYSGCGSATLKMLALTHTAILTPAAPASITITKISDICSARVYRYTAPALIAQTTTSAPATGWKWTMPTGSVGATGMLVAGTLTSQSIDIQYSSNAAATSADIIKVCYSSSCGMGSNKSQQLTNSLKTIPDDPSGLSKTLISDVCGARVYRFTVTAVSGADGYSWLIPSSMGGVTGVTLVGGNLSNSNYIDLQFRFNGASLVTDKVNVRAFNTCGNSLYTGFKMSIVAKSGCPSSTTKTSLESTDQKKLGLSIFPNPTHDLFKINVEGNKRDKVLLNINDASGRLLSSEYIDTYRPVSKGAELKAGIYLIEAIQGEIKKTIKLVKY